MRLDNFCCPVCKKPLAVTTAKLCCAPCERDFAIVDDIPDLFVGDVEQDFVDDPNRTWLDPRIVEARDTVYRLCSRELKGMIFCMQEIGRRVRAGCRILEVGMGTGHFTRWLAKVSEPGTEIYAFDFSWPIIEKAKANTQGLSGITLFRANARRSLPFADTSFDIVLVRLAPLGARGIPNVQAGFELLKPGGWYFQAGWKPEQYETPPTEWAIQHGYKDAEHHVWQYRRMQTEQEYAAMQIEQERLASMGCKSVEETLETNVGNPQGKDRSILKMTHENLLIAQKPVQ